MNVAHPARLAPGVLADPVALTRALVDIESVSGDEAEITDAVEAALREAGHLSVRRAGNTLLARTDLGRERRVVLAGHLDTVPVAGNLPSTVDGDVMSGCGTSDMKSGSAIALWLALTLAEPRYDVSYFFYDCEEIEASRNGLRKVAEDHPEWLTADLAILLEPTYGLVEAGCQGTMRAVVSTTGRRAHAARSWLGANAIHAAGEALRRLDGYGARRVTIDGCEYREGLNAVRISGGVAGNVIPDACEIEVNYRFAPDRSVAEAEEHLRQTFDGFAVTIVDSAPGALPGLAAVPAREFLAMVGQPPAAKLGWTDVARFAGLGIPALNYGPGDPNVAHARDERVEIPKIREGARTLAEWLSPASG
ncbi:MAG TPA: succinyl-diaminopimelate desuccinylase [Rugosimonospora sp.]